MSRGTISDNMSSASSSSSSSSDETLNPPAEVVCPLLDLPAELRNLIYHFALIDPPLWKKRHSPFCEYSPRTVDDIPIPPMALIMLPTKHPLPQCPCTRRQGIKLLRACRQVHHEASPIFWSKNVFLFNKRVDFITCVGRTMSRSDRNWLTHVAVVDPQWGINHPLRMRADRDGLANGTSSRHLWEVLLKCKNLRRVDLEPDYLDYQGQQMRKIKRKLPHLRDLRTARLHFRAYMAPPEDVPGVQRGWRAPPRVPSIVFYSTISMQFQDIAGMSRIEAQEAAHGLTLNSVFIFAARLNRAVTNRLGIPKGNAQTMDATYDGLGTSYPYDWVEQYMESPAAVIRYDDSAIEVQIMGLPLSPYQLWANLAPLAAHRRLTATGAGNPEAVVYERYWARIKWRRLLFRRLRTVLAVVGYHGLAAFVRGMRRFGGRGDRRVIILAEAALSVAANWIESIDAMGNPADWQGMPEESACARVLDNALTVATCYVMRRIYRRAGVEYLL